MGILGKIFGGSPNPGKPSPVTDDSFEAEVLKSDIPAAVDFWASWCAPCQVMGGLLDEIGPEYQGRVNIFKLNVDRARETAARFGVRSVPTVILFRDGKPVDRIVGLLPLRPLRQKLDKLAGLVGEEKQDKS
jgi:thioredoxin 1